MDPATLLALLLEFLGLQSGFLPALILKLLKLWLTQAKKDEFVTMVRTRALARAKPGAN